MYTEDIHACMVVVYKYVCFDHTIMYTVGIHNCMMDTYRSNGWRLPPGDVLRCHSLLCRPYLAVRASRMAPRQLSPKAKS